MRQGRSRGSKVKKYGLIVRLAACLIASCGGGDALHGEGETPRGPIFRERIVKSGAQTKKVFGQSCNEFGKAECMSGICLHAGADREAGYVCTQTCGSEFRGCPPGWNCQTAVPGGSTRLCVPTSAVQPASRGT